ncbi:MAG: hypothetical protein ND866_05410 [Pyrinomonadaceae bacterium]|nr:hypothetical protein [Pyrinomonadaceae bacterium]
MQSLAGLARASKDRAAYAAARKLNSQKDEFDFSWSWLCEADITCLELARAARELGMKEEALSFLEDARKAGSIEALRENWV